MGASSELIVSLDGSIVLNNARKSSNPRFTSDRLRFSRCRFRSERLMRAYTSGLGSPSTSSVDGTAKGGNVLFFKDVNDEDAESS